MSLTTFLQQYLTGISPGGTHALIAIGCILVYGIPRLINSTHDDTSTTAGYFMIFVIASLPWLIIVPITLIVTILLGVTTGRVAYRPLRPAPRTSVIISTVDVSYFLQDLATCLFTTLSRGYPETPFLKKIFRVDGLSASFITLPTPVLTLMSVYLLVLLINYTKIGMAMRAVSKDRKAALLVGTKISKTITFTFAVGSLLAGIGSVLYFTDYMTVFPFPDAFPGLKCFVATVFEGIDSIPGAVIGDFILGLGETALVVMGQSTFNDAFTSIPLIIMFLVRPTGFLGERMTDKV